MTVEEGNTFGLELEFTEGMQFDKGYISPHFVTDPERLEAVLDDPYILLANQKIASVRDLLPVLEKVMQASKPLLVVAEDVEGEALATLVVNRIRGTFASVAVKAPGFGDRRKAMLEDIAVLTGGQVIVPRARPQARERHHRHARPGPQGHVTKDDTTIIEGAGDSERVERPHRPAQVGDRETPTRTGTRRRSRSGWPSCPAAWPVIRVGAATEVELKEKKHRIEDALSATRAAIEEGIVPGGGTALMRAREAVDKAADEASNGDEATGARIVAHALAEPLRWIAKNAGPSGPA